MSAVVHEDYRRREALSIYVPTRLRRTLVAAAGCALMAISGAGLGLYLNTSSATAADTSQASAAAD
jgi:hypothetical protein